MTVSMATITATEEEVNQFLQRQARAGGEEAWLIRACKPKNKPIESWGQAQVLVDRITAHFDMAKIRVKVSAKHTQRRHAKCAPMQRLITLFQPGGLNELTICHEIAHVLHWDRDGACNHGNGVQGSHA